MRQHLLALFVLASISGSAACSSTSTPASPSPISGVTLNGSVVAPGTGGGSTNGTSLSGGGTAVSIPAGLTVSVVGTNMSAQVEASGQFALRGVPAGNIELRFTATGLTASVTVLGLQTGQTVTIAVSLTGSTASLESDRRSMSGQEQLEGRVESLPPTTAVLTLVVAGTTVTTDTNTTFFLRGAPASFASLEIGQRVHVKGTTSGGALLASSVDIQNTNTDVGLNLNGVISGFTGTPSAFQFTVNGQLVKGDANTVFFGNSQFAELVDGATVEVKGSPRDGYVYASRIHIEREDLEFTATITAKSGTAPNLTLTIGAYTVKTSSLTDVRRKGDTQDPSTLQLGQTVTVTGSLLPGGTVPVVVARKISIEADAVGGLFEMEGPVGGLSGTCPTISFSVNGYVIHTTAVAPVTTFTPSCAAISNGTKVLVKGKVQADFSVLASEVKK